jgi:hypothetical protein
MAQSCKFNGVTRIHVSVGNLASLGNEGDDIEPVYSKMRHSRVVEGRIDPLEVYIMPLEIRYRNIGI